MLETVIIAVLILLLASAAAWDFASRSIPNAVIVLVALTGLMRVTAGTNCVSSVWAAAALLLLLLVLYARNLIGGGDVKLMTALSLALTAPDTYRFVIATALFGGLLAITHLLLRRILPPRRCSPGAPRLLRIMAVEAWRIRRGLSLPYGVAIAAGGIFVLLHPTPW